MAKKTVTKEQKTDLVLTIWSEFTKSLPDIVAVLKGPTESAMSGKYGPEIARILGELKDDLAAFQAGKIDKIEFEDLVGRRKAAIFALFNADKISQQRPSVQKILSAVESIVGILLTKAVPIILAAL